LSASMHRWDFSVLKDNHFSFLFLSFAYHQSEQKFNDE
jgi:hypothetical protein